MASLLLPLLATILALAHCSPDETLETAPTAQKITHTAKFDSGGVTGFFKLGAKDYGFSLDLSKFNTTCDLSKGLGYHIHVNWTSSNTSATGAACGGAFTENHYDPYLGCGPASQGRFNGSVVCTAARGASYAYNCTPSVFRAGYLSNCEAGDLSGKFGNVFSDANNVFARVDKNDLLPPLVVDYDKNNAVGTKWLSVIFHCGVAPFARLACAKLVPVKKCKYA